jgi:hypothetical protein
MVILRDVISVVACATNTSPPSPKILTTKVDGDVFERMATAMTDWTLYLGVMDVDCGHHGGCR